MLHKRGLPDVRVRGEGVVTVLGGRVVLILLLTPGRHQPVQMGIWPRMRSDRASICAS